MLFTETETARLNRIIAHGAGTAMTEQEFFAREIEAWKRSPERQAQLLGERYYRGEHDILRHRREVIGPDGRLQPVGNLPNNRVVDNQFAKMVDQKANYLLGRPFTVKSGNGGLGRPSGGCCGMSGRMHCAAGWRGWRFITVKTGRCASGISRRGRCCRSGRTTATPGWTPPRGCMSRRCGTGS